MMKVKHTYYLKYITGRLSIFASLCCLMTLLLAHVQPALAQSNKVTGTVKDRQGNPLPGVRVAIKNTAISTSTGAKGSFTLNLLEANAIVTFNHLGYAEEERTIKNGDKLEIVLMETVHDLEQVVVVGYGTQKRGDV